MCSQLFYDLDDMKQKMLNVFTVILRFRQYETDNTSCVHIYFTFKTI